MQYRKKPFRSVKLNELDLECMVICGVTVIAAIFMIGNKFAYFVTICTLIISIFLFIINFFHIYLIIY